MGMPEGEEEEQEIENLFEHITKNFPNLAKKIDFQEAQRVPKKLHPRKHAPRHIIRLKERILNKSSKRKRRQLPTKEFS